jgi:hypothetical protein
MSGQYYIDGPVSLGTTATTTSINGNIVLTNTTTSAGDLVYANGSNIITRLGITNNGILIGGATAPSWLAAGTDGNVLTMVAGSPAWAAASTDASQYGFMVFKNANQTAIGSTPVVLATWDAAVYADPEYDSTSGAFVPATGIFTVPGLVGVKTRWNANVNVTLAQSINTNTAATDVHIVRLLLNATPIATVTVNPGPRNTYLSILTANINTNFEAKGTDTVTIDATCDNGGDITVFSGAGTTFGLVKISTV